MQHLNIEIKARCKDPLSIEDILRSKNARFVGLDHQIDTYFSVPNGRLKLREGTIENALIHYARTDQAGPKQSDIVLEKVEKGSAIKEILTKANGILAVVDKKRKIYFIDNVKFHIDAVISLGNFVEIEAIDSDGSIGREKLLEQCQFYLDLFKIETADLLTHSYSDM